MQFQAQVKLSIEQKENKEKKEILFDLCAQ
jgi:hypothetical protein